MRMIFNAFWLLCISYTLAFQTRTPMRANKSLNMLLNAKRETILKSQYFPLDNEKSEDPKGREKPKQDKPDVERTIEVFLPLVAPFIAFATYEYVAQGFSAFIDSFSSTNWIAVDGGALQAKIIQPAINGVIVPSISLLYATLTSTTISTLRQRQLDIRRAINLEAGELRNLGHIVYSYPESRVKEMCRTYLIQYTTRILQESAPHVASGEDVVDPGKGMDTELNGFLIQVHEGYNNPIPPHLADESFAAVTRLREHRINRITALQSTYPNLHWATLIILALAVCTSFLMETNQDVLFFLSAFQLKLLWSIVVGTFVACFTVFYDLGSPFSGSYQISACVGQLHTIRKALKTAGEIQQQQQQRQLVTKELNYPNGE